MSLPPSVKIVEVGPRDGLQNEKQAIPTQAKVQLIENLVDAGLTYIEAGSFVNPKWVPQMADSGDVFKQIQRKDKVTYAALIPNLQGYERAINVDATEVAIFAAASEMFSQKNINCSIAESIDRFDAVLSRAKQDNIPVRGYISCVLGCPFSGSVDPQLVTEIAQELLRKGCYEISLGDTIGVGTAGDTNRLLRTITQQISVEKLAVHFHDTYGQALTNVYASLLQGISVVDASVAGLGGCPYAPGAAGNLATEDLVYMLNGLHIETHIDLEKLIAAGNTISHTLQRTSGSRVARALHGR